MTSHSGYEFSGMEDFFRVDEIRDERIYPDPLSADPEAYVVIFRTSMAQE